MRGLWAVAAAGVILAACASTPSPAPIATNTHTPPPTAPRPPVVVPEQPAPPITPPYHPRPVVSESLTRLPGWSEEDHVAALAAFQAGCGAGRDPLMRDLCLKARSMAGADDRTARLFFEDNFRAEPAGDPPGSAGMMTAYFAPEYEARPGPDPEFSAPVRPKPGRPMDAPPPPASDPDDLIGAVLAESEPAPAPMRIDLSNADRATIERLPGDGALAWMRPEDLFFLQIQGSGTLVFPDGRRLKAAYASDNGRPFVAIARPMVNQRLLGASGASGEAIRSWLAAHRGREAQAIMWLNPRYVFFSLVPDDGREPAGAAGVPLPAGRAIAVDPGRHTYGEVFWIDANAPVLAGANKTYRRLAMALDTGAAIRGEVRADLYVGRGAAAGTEAGRVRHTLRMTRLVPIAPDARAGSASHETAVASGGG